MPIHEELESVVSRLEANIQRFTQQDRQQIREAREHLDDGDPIYEYELHDMQDLLDQIE